MGRHLQILGAVRKWPGRGYNWRLFRWSCTASTLSGGYSADDVKRMLGPDGSKSRALMHHDAKDCRVDVSNAR
jgi:hypothetical protein